jgi:copper chaperone CopZ
MLAMMPALGGFAFSQVEKAAMKTTGISCGMCAAVSEVYLRQLAGIDKIKISLSQEAIMVSYKPGAAFQPKQLHEALKKTDVGIVQLQIGARGRIEGQGEKRFFVAGNDRFAVVSTPNGTEIPVNTPLAIEGILNDQAQPMELKILTFKIAK